MFTNLSPKMAPKMSANNPPAAHESGRENVRENVREKSLMVFQLEKKRKHFREHFREHFCGRLGEVFAIIFGTISGDRFGTAAWDSCMPLLGRARITEAHMARKGVHTLAHFGAQGVLTHHAAVLLRLVFIW